MNENLILRRAMLIDSTFFYEVRNEPSVRAVSEQTGVIEPDQHAVWFRRALDDPGRELYVVEGVGPHGPLGYLRIDRDGDWWLVSIAICRYARGRGVGQDALRLLARACPTRHFRARIKTENTISRSVFGKAGYSFIQSDGDVLIYERPSGPA